MTNLTNKQKCIKMRDGIEIWVDEDKIERIETDLYSGNVGKFLKVQGNLVNIVDITGIYKPETMEEVVRRKNGEWKCPYGVWHKRGQECNCKPVINEFEKTKELYKPAERKNSHEHNMQTLKKYIETANL